VLEDGGFRSCFDCFHEFQSEDEFNRLLPALETLHDSLSCLYTLFALKQSTSSKTLVSLAILLVGLTLFMVNDVACNVVGTIIGLIAVVTTATYQTLTQTSQKTFKISGTQLSHRIGLPQFVICFGAGLVVETRGRANTLQQQYSLYMVLLALLTGVLAASATSSRSRSSKGRGRSPSRSSAMSRRC
jgi:hypothetical protein